jgi:hypothetical protein
VRAHAVAFIIPFAYSSCKVVANGTPYMGFVAVNNNALLITLESFAVWLNGPFQVDAFSVCYLAYPP